jgi:hypothetical protein
MVALLASARLRPSKRHHPGFQDSRYVQALHQAGIADDSSGHQLSIARTRLEAGIGGLAPKLHRRPCPVSGLDGGVVYPKMPTAAG